MSDLIPDEERDAFPIDDDGMVLAKSILGYWPGDLNTPIAEHWSEWAKARHSADVILSAGFRRPSPVTREVLIEAMKAVDSLTVGTKSCARPGCNHWAGYQDSGSTDWCACHYGADTSECDGQPEPSLPTVERYADAILSRFSLPEPAETERRKVLKPIEDFMATVHGMNEMNVIRGLRKVIKGEHSTFTHEVRLSVYGAPCGHEVPSHYPNGYGECDDCKEERRGF